MQGLIVTPPKVLQPIAGLSNDPIPDLPCETLTPDYCPGRQPGGRRVAERLLDTFLQDRGARYHLEMSSPLSAVDSCSRLSAHLAWGTLSLREVVQATRQRRVEIKNQALSEHQPWRRALSAFEGRLHWRCHFMQKLESEPRIEFENLHCAMDGLRDEVADPERLDAWTQGQTGWPLVDACMRALYHTGWINFRMRALLVSVASYQLWMHWREPALHLARLFVDFEPGIHYSQVQMQSGTTGINKARIYNPVKQSRDQDPEGEFIRRWVPELAHVETPWIHTPWMMSRAAQRAYGCIIGKTYPAPLVNHEQAARKAREQLYAKRRNTEAQRESRAIFDRHGSRKRTTPRTRQTTRAPLE
jgi:deoxyribodipyrimidine photo-lyase